MARTYKDLIYLVFDELKITSDDSVWENEHISHMLNKYRALLIKQRYSDKQKPIPRTFYQRLNVSMVVSNYQPANIIKSKYKIPDILDNSLLWTSYLISGDSLSKTPTNFVNPYRFRTIGHNKWTRLEKYATIDFDGYMYMLVPGINAIDRQNSEIYGYDDSNIIGYDDSQIISEIPGDFYVYFDAILDNPIDIINFDESIAEEIIYDNFNLEFPVEESLVQTIVDLCVKELSTANQYSKDITNNAIDDYSVQSQRNQKQQKDE